ncbi:MAG: TetR/AcrR family transcriptional regulator, partial [Dehalococcoidia bacterium]
YHAAAMDDIAERAGVSKPVLYQHFPGKLELYLALLDQGGDQLVEAVRKALASSTENKQRVLATMEAYFGFVEDEGAAFRLVFESDLTGQEAVRERMDRVNAECAEAICGIVSEDTGLPRDQAMLLAAGMAGVAQTMARQWVSDRESVDRGTAVQLGASLVWRGIRGFPRKDDQPS